MFTGCAATGATTEPPAIESTQAAKPPTAIELVQQADPDNLGDGLMYTKISENNRGQYVRVGADKKSKVGKFDSKLWTKTGKSWTEADHVKAQLLAVNVVYQELLSGVSAGGTKKDAAAQAKSLTKVFSKMDQEQNDIGNKLANFYKGPDNANGLQVWADPNLNNFAGYNFYQSKDASRFLNPTVKITTAQSFDVGDNNDSGKAEIDGATVTVQTNFDWKMTKGGKTFKKPTEIVFDVYIMKEEGKIVLHGAGLGGAPSKSKPQEATF